ncbi:MAG: hypothetical protein Q8T09_13975 [Candidatus Melainabacteria bacterium]|nr:hypothetical protein [Candidatus Melainabacteria bacterium]
MALQIGPKPENQSRLATADLPGAQIIPILLIAGLGFLVDVYDIVLFAVVRIPSLESLGVAPQNSLAAGVLLLNMQMAGMIVGGLRWGTLGEVLSGILSQFLRSRKLAMLVFVAGALVSAALVLNSPPQVYGLLCLPLGFFVGYWSVVVTSTAEQFGTNLRATATTLVPNLVRASTIPITALFSYLASICGPVNSAMITGVYVLPGRSSRLL